MTEYLATLPKETRATLERVRAAIRQAIPAAEEDPRQKEKRGREVKQLARCVFEHDGAIRQIFDSGVLSTKNPEKACSLQLALRCRQYGKHYSSLSVHVRDAEGCDGCAVARDHQPIKPTSFSLRRTKWG